MTKKIIIALSLATVSLLNAESAFSKHALGVKAGTLGLGLEYATNISSDIDFRVGINGFKYNTDGKKDDISYDIDLDLLSASAIIDYHPFSNGFILSAGVMYNGNEINYKGEADSGSFEINDVVYNAADVGSLNGKSDFNSIAPYIGIGYSTVTKSEGFHFIAELGVMYQGSASTSLNATCGASLTAAQCTTLQADVAAEEKVFEDETKDYKWYPVASVGVSYRF